MHHPRGVGRDQGVADLLDEPVHPPKRPTRTVARVVGNRATAREPEHEIGGTRLAPEVVQRHDVRMLEPGHQPRFTLETADVARVVGELGSHNLHRHIAAHPRLHRTVDRPELALTNDLREHVPTHASANRHKSQRRIRHRNPTFQFNELARRVKPDLVSQNTPVSMERTQRVGLPTRTEQRHHQLRPKSVPQRMLRHQSLELGHHLYVSTEIETRLHPRLQSNNTDLLKAHHRRPTPLLVRKLTERTPVPQTQRLIQQPHRGRRRFHCRGTHPGNEPLRVNRHVTAIKPVPLRTR